jgi:Ca2+/Na+ antiporter
MVATLAALSYLAYDPPTRIPILGRGNPGDSLVAGLMIVFHPEVYKLRKTYKRVGCYLTICFFFLIPVLLLEFVNLSSDGTRAGAVGIVLWAFSYLVFYISLKRAWEAKAIQELALSRL